MKARHRTVVEQFSRDIADIAAKCRPAVATIRCESRHRTSSGSGFLVDSTGNVVTNYHVVEGCNEVEVQFAEDLLRSGSVAGTDLLTDLAIIRVGEPLPGPLPIRADHPVLGELCVAIGSPLGEYAESVSIGIVSGVARTIPTTRGRPLERAIQTDVAINPGNSGGPLIDAMGQVIGVNTCVDARAVGIGFAIPGETLDWVARQITEYGDVRRGALGLAAANRVEKVQGHLRHVPLITAVSADVTCDIRPGDIILSVAGNPVHDRSDLYYMLTRDMIGKSIQIELRRGDDRVLRETPVKEYVPPAVVHQD